MPVGAILDEGFPVNLRIFPPESNKVKFPALVYPPPYVLQLAYPGSGRRNDSITLSIPVISQASWKPW